MNNIPKRPEKPMSLTAAIVNLFSKLLTPLERLTENKLLLSDNTKVLKTQFLTHEALHLLFTNQVLAIHIPGYYEQNIANQLAINILKERLSNWNVTDINQQQMDSDFFVYGTPFNTAFKSEELWQKYFNTTNQLNEFFRRTVPNNSPLDRIKNDIDSNYLHGLKIRKYMRYNMTPGLIRVMYGKQKAEFNTIPYNCHVDNLPMLSKKRGLFSINLYFKTPPLGGELYLWGLKINNLIHVLKNWYFIKNFFLKQSYLNHELQEKIHSCLPSFSKISVQAGDLVIINTSRPHAIGDFEGDPRVSYQAFLNYKKNEPLEIWA